MAKRKRLATTVTNALQTTPATSFSCGKVPYEIWLLIFTQLRNIDSTSIRAIVLVSRKFNSIVAPLSCETFAVRRRAPLQYEVPLPLHRDVFLERTRHIREITITNAAELENEVHPLEVDVDFFSIYLHNVQSISWRRTSPGPTALEQIEFHRLWPGAQFCLDITSTIRDPDRFTFLQPVLWRSLVNLFSLELSMERPFDTRRSDEDIWILEKAITTMVQLRILKLSFYATNPEHYEDRVDTTWAFPMDSRTRFPPLKHLSLRGAICRRSRTYPPRFFDWSQVEKLVLLDCDEWDILETITHPPSRLRMVNIEDGDRFSTQRHRTHERRQRNVSRLVSATRHLESFSVRASPGRWKSYEFGSSQEMSCVARAIMPRAQWTLKYFHMNLGDARTATARPLQSLLGILYLHTLSCSMTLGWHIGAGEELAHVRPYYDFFTRSKQGAPLPTMQFLIQRGHLPGGRTLVLDFRLNRRVRQYWELDQQLNGVGW